jgi:uncharacterized protein (DUF2384 family)
MAAGSNDSLRTILTDLQAVRATEEELLSRLAALINHQAVDMPQHLAEVCSQAKDVFGLGAAAFLGTPNSNLHGQMPLLVAQEPHGAEEVKELLARIAYGTYS